jgi:hypothetical protein
MTVIVSVADNGLLKAEYLESTYTVTAGTSITATTSVTAGTTVITDAIEEKTTDAGISVTGNLLGGSSITATTSVTAGTTVITDAIEEKTTDAGISVTGNLLAGSSITATTSITAGTTVITDAIEEKTTGAGVSVTGDLIINDYPYVKRYSDDINGANIFLEKGRGTESSPSAPLSGDVLATIIAKSNDGTNITNTGAVKFLATENHSTTTLGTTVGFDTTINGDTVRHERARFDATTGAFCIGLTSSDADYLLQLPNSSTKKAKAQAWNTYSDSRVKENQKDLKYGLDAVMELKPKSFTLRDSTFENGKLNLSGGIDTIGLIAQEVYKVVPEAACKPVDENKELWGMNNDKLIPVLIKAIQELTQKVQELEKR